MPKLSIAPLQQRLTILEEHRQTTHPNKYTGRYTGVRLLGGLLFSSTIGLLAYRRRSLSASGVVGAITTGTTTFGLGGITWGLSLIFFFVSSSLLSHFREKEKEATAADKFSKGSQRDISQVAANGGIATLAALAYGLTRSSAIRETLQAGYVGALATANADTWATELGVLNRDAPRLITTGKKAAPGTSGAVSWLGSVAAAAGAFTLGLVFWLLKRGTSLRLPFIALISGSAGSLFDSFLGATVQIIYYCPTCDKETERRVHNCGTPTFRLRGISWMNNDVVNFLATLCGSLVAIIINLPFRRIATHHQRP